MHGEHQIVGIDGSGEADALVDGTLNIVHCVEVEADGIEHSKFEREAGDTLG